MANGNFSYLDADKNWHELNDPSSDQCISLDPVAWSAINKTDSKALLYSAGLCNEPPFLGLNPGETWNDASLRSATSVRFEFA
jgi:hypothetical protein